MIFCAFIYFTVILSQNPPKVSGPTQALKRFGPMVPLFCGWFDINFIGSKIIGDIIYQKNTVSTYIIYYTYIYNIISSIILLYIYICTMIHYTYSILGYALAPRNWGPPWGHHGGARRLYHSEAGCLLLRAAKGAAVQRSCAFTSGHDGYMYNLYVEYIESICIYI